MDLPIFLDLLKFTDYQISRLPFETVKCTYSLFLRRIFSKMLNAVSLHHFILRFTQYFQSSFSNVFLCFSFVHEMTAIQSESVL